MICITKSSWRRGGLPRTVSLIALAALSGAMIQAASPTLIRTINNPVPQQGDLFGRNMMATTDGHVITGAHLSDVNGVTDVGEAYVINAATGAVVHTLANPEPQENAGFGAFAWAGDTRLAVSAYGKTDGANAESGRVYLFDRATGTHTIKINNPSPGTEELFGYGLGMLGDKVIASAHGDDTGGLDAGIVYLFDGHTGALLRTIQNPAPTSQDNFGYTVCGFAGNKIAVGAPGDDSGATDAGTVYVFNADTGALLFEVPPPDPAQAGQFGFQVRARGNDLLVGAPGQQRAYLFNGDTGELRRRLNNPEPAAEEGFGSTVGAVGHHILVGNAFKPFNGMAWVGRAYLFNGNNGFLMQTYVNPTPQTNDRYGISVVGVAGNVVVGADQDPVAGQPGAGSLYIYAGPQTAARDWSLYW